jgi:hypothetical protein
MAEKRRMTAVEVVDKVMGSEHADVVRESVAWLVSEIMEAEVAGQIGAELGEVTAERVTQRNGYRARAWDTRAGELELRIPKLRSGSDSPSFLEPRRRAEQALVAVVREAYVNGVSTRKVDRLVEQMGVHMSKDQVSRLCRGLDEQVLAFRERPLEGRYPYRVLGPSRLWSTSATTPGARDVTAIRSRSPETSRELTTPCCGGVDDTPIRSYPPALSGWRRRFGRFGGSTNCRCHSSPSSMIAIPPSGSLPQRRPSGDGTPSEPIAPWIAAATPLWPPLGQDTAFGASADSSACRTAGCTTHSRGGR